MTLSRRNFVRSSLIAGVPLVLPGSIWGAKVNPNDKMAMGFVGVGKQSRGLLNYFLHQDSVQVVAVCDVDTTRREDAKKKVDDKYKSADCKVYNDFRKLMARKDIDLVCIATPDHWHAYITIEALKNGKDVYCEKPLTHNVHEAIEVMKAVEKYGRVLQTGSMQRSYKEFRVACELVQNGVIGKISHVECQFGDPGRPYDLKKEDMEPGLDWNMWCGPGPLVDYNPVLSPRGIHNNFPRWRTYKEFGGGSVTDWGAHHLDIAQWGLGRDGDGPIEVRPPEKADGKRGAKLIYDDGIYVEHKDGFGVHFYGSEGEVQVNRGRFTLKKDGRMFAKFTKREDGSSCGAQVVKAEKAFLQDAKIKLYKSSSHPGNFLECVASRKKPITSEIIGGGSAICCNLMNQSYYNHAKILWDPKKKQLRDGGGDPKWLTREYRGPWNV
ncbi:MAG: Gfo/Idh/MocA family oxidoreductase [Kiritimatiellae bacterium]|jgi:predicted dehydrogenase|nr:Gfo/Idh/MocA family oxidoreductase [Kiritimatiellia bacterium]